MYIKPQKQKAYEIHKQLGGKFKVVEFSKYENETTIRKRTIAKNLNMSEAEDFVYKLEKK